jgi:hypothetical protein
LNQGGTLPSFQIEPLEANNSRSVRLIFAEPVAKFLDRNTCILKICPAGHDFFAASEPNYYTRDYVRLANAPIPECYATVWSGAATAQSIGDGYALILEDLGADYTDNMLIRPDKGHAANLGHALALLHAHRWGRNADPEEAHDLSADFRKFLTHVSSGLGPILDEMGDTLDASSRARLVKVFDTDADRMLDRAIEGRGLALVHGDPNPTNVLTAKTPQQNRPPLYIIDRQPFQWSLRLWLGASDLVYAAVPFWSEDNRRAFQDTLLAQYHRTLLANGVQGYSWEDLLDDWDICACMAAFTAIEWGSDPASLTGMKWLWEPQVRRALALLEDCDAG